MGRTMIEFWPEFEGAACYAAHKYFGDNNRRSSRKKEYETYQSTFLSEISQLEVVFVEKKTVFLEVLFPGIKEITGCKKIRRKARKLIRQSLFSRIRHDSQRHLQNLKI
ncbi:Protein CBG04955 [Caenorhabditis briggsae]|uniref:Protein CBG04955 n=1 Tax=Caenorhabditis briggsae TaxID=6238 RepID=A8WYW1_CAEBR|nr:Protein CBG04955 [Caenorhabditis briggsae]CAP25569.1 Protein CBG04955 [Caenorhabditis briggsae]